MARLAVVICLVVLLLSPAFGRSPTQSKNPVQRDPAAVQLVTSMIASCGWNLSLPSTIQATGTATFNGTTEPVVVEAIPGWLRIGRPQSNVVLLVHGTNGELITSGKGQFLNGGAAASIQAFMFPFYTELTNLADPNLGVTLGAQQIIQGSPAQVVNFASSAVLGDGSDPFRQAASRIGVAISLSNSQPLAIHFSRMSQADGNKGASVDAVLGDFRSVGGMLVPFQYSEVAPSQTLFSIQFDTVTFNAPIPPSDFTFVASN
jgi:hypothetical protein